VINHFDARRFIGDAARQAGDRDHDFLKCRVRLLDFLLFARALLLSSGGNNAC
jgi:hypothetical protein